METGINSIEGLLTPARGFRSSRPTCRKPLLFDPAQSACYQEGGGPLLPPAPGVVCFQLAFSLMFPAGRRSSPTSFFWVVLWSRRQPEVENGITHPITLYPWGLACILPSPFSLTPTTMSVAVSLVMALIVLNPTDELCRS